MQFKDEESNNEFPKYNPDLLEGNVTFWSDNFLSLKEDKFPSIKFEFEKNDTQREFKAKLLKALKVTGECSEDFFFFRRLDLSSSNFSFIEILQNAYDFDKPILISALVNGCRIYVERKEYEEHSSFTTSKKPKMSNFIQLMDSFSNEILICFNKPENISKASLSSTISHKWDFSVKVNLKDSVLSMKIKMAAVLNISENDFIIKKYGPSANEIKDLNALVCSISTSDINIFTQLGTPLKENQILFNLSFVQYDESEFKVFPYKFTSLDKYIVNKNQKVKDIKADLIGLVQNKVGIKIEKEENLILRWCIQDKPTRVSINNNKCLIILILRNFIFQYFNL